MMSTATIRNLQLEAAARASREGKTPLVIWERGELTSAPFLGDYIPPGWRTALWTDVPIARPSGSSWWNGEQATLFVDSSGFGNDDEPALSLAAADEFVHRLLAADPRTWGFGILEAGQFQVYIGLYVKDDASPGVPVDDEEFGLCPECGEPDGEFDEHDCQSPTARLEYLRGEIEAERISYGEIAELQGLAEYIDSTDVVLLQWAGVPEFPEDADQGGRPPSRTGVPPGVRIRD